MGVRGYPQFFESRVKGTPIFLRKFRLFSAKPTSPEGKCPGDKGPGGGMFVRG